MNVHSDRVAIFGSGGQLGVELKTEFTRRGYEVGGFERSIVDITDEANDLVARGLRVRQVQREERHHEAGRAEQMAYLAGNGGINWFSWTSFSVLGVVLANFVPTAWGLGFAGILALVGMMASLATSRLRWVSAGVAGAAGVVWGLPAAHRLRPPFDIAAAVVVLAGVICSVIGVLLTIIPNFFR